jgi:hypothetical protein
MPNVRSFTDTENERLEALANRILRHFGEVSEPETVAKVRSFIDAAIWDITKARNPEKSKKSNYKPVPKDRPKFKVLPIKGAYAKTWGSKGGVFKKNLLTS